MMMLIKGILSGLGAALIAFVAITLATLWLQHASRVAQGRSGLGAVAGGWTVYADLLILVFAFGLGFWLSLRK